MSTSSEFNEEQLAAARKSLWQQTGEAMVTLEAAREWIERLGLVPFAPGKLAMVAPTLVEATLGATNTEPSAAESAIARELVGRLASEGAALPLNLLGSPGDTPDFVVSGAAFKYIFTLRGDKSWKQAPSTSGAVKVSPLGLRVYETLVERGAMTAAELATELGREVTEAAIVRALSELWQMLRVVPVYAQGDGATMWELTGKRFTKAIKAGVNAGQPTALSALVSMYLAQALVATEDEVETFLSPVAARSRVREVLHALTGARELGEVVVAGKTLLHVAGDLPVFAPLPGTEVEAAAEGDEPAAEGADAPSRITTFAGAKKTYAERSPFAKKAAADAEFAARPPRSAPRGGPRTREAGNVAFKRTPRESAGEYKPKRTFGGDRPSPRAGDRERKPFVKREGAAAKPSFTKPWNEDKKPRVAAFDKYNKSGDDAPVDRATRRAEKFGEPFDASKQEAVNRERPAKPFTPREASERKPYERKSFGAGKPAFGAKRPYTPREGGERMPFGERKSFGAGKPAFGAKRPYTPREGGAERKPFGDRKPFDGPKRPYTPREGGASARPSFGGGDRPKRAYTPREGGSSFDRPKRPYTPREGGSFDGPKRPYTPREGGSSFDRPKRPYTPREGGDRKPFSAKPAFGRKPFGAGDGARPFRPRPEGGDRPFRPRPDAGGDGRPPRKTFGSKPGGNFRSKSSGGSAAKPKYGMGKTHDKKGPLPADGEGGLSPSGSKRRQQREKE